MIIHPTSDKQLSELEQLINYHFKNKSLLIEALSHPSLKQHGHRASPHRNYERLELLGDTILGFVITDILFKNFTEFDEGKLARIRSNLVCKDMLCRVAAKLNIADYIIMTEGEEISGGRGNPSNIENAMEALIAAIYLDSDIYTAQRIIQNLWQEFLNSKELSYTDPKTALQEWAQSRRYNKPTYTVIDRSGPAHLPNFVVSVSVENYEAKGEGNAIKIAEKIAAKKLLHSLEEKEH